MTVKPPNAMCYIPGMLRQTPNINVHIKPLVSKVILRTFRSYHPRYCSCCDELVMISKTQTVMRSNSNIWNNRAFYVALHMNGTVDEIETKKGTR